MPLIKSAIKRAKQNTVRQDRRKPVKSLMKTMIKKMEDAAKAGKKDEVLKLLPETYKAIDMAAKRHILHKNTAARKKSAMAKLAAAK
ncbi:MAG: 30S ribosomal protein S20 [Candidatus Peribacteraceae bacterium]|nr:30S ribosomal protein S20 [Candidatus Peribacteraceae bacterium]